MPAFDTIILLTGQVEQQPLSAALLAWNSLLRIVPVSTLSDLLALDPETLNHARLVAFSTNVIVPAATLNRLGFGAYNFHPASPDFPGWAPAYLALHRGAGEFGATAHMMTERVDEGPIVGVERFRIPPQTSPASLEGLAYGHLALLFWRFAKLLATQDAPLPPLWIKWRGEKSSRRLFRTILQQAADVSDEALIQAMRASIG
ncbi:MAG: formyltransferase family protein [Pseudorhodoplanes sp.]